MAIVCFSRRDVLRIKALIQENSEHKVAVVYGNLSPQVRREEARRFRSGEADILVATDAIAMGLNLPISEVLFFTTAKFNGEEMVELTPPEIRQIGGRAGRFGFAQFGVVNALDSDSLELIREAIQGTGEVLQPPFYVAPGHNHIRIISEVLGTTSLERILTFFERAIEFSDERFARSNIDELSYLSTFVDERLPFLDITQRLTIACAPVAIRNETVLHWFLDRILPAFPDPARRDQEVDQLDDLFDAARRFEVGAASSQMKLRDAEDYLKTLTVYAWLAYRYPAVFTRIDECEERREAVNAYVERSLRKAPQESTGGADRSQGQRRRQRGRRR
jgi:ATP-dependent RNA helicase SUPV3L1/SUV3